MALLLLPLAHAGHWLVNAAYLAPVVGFLGWLGWVTWKDRREDGAGRGREDDGMRRFAARIAASDRTRTGDLQRDRPGMFSGFPVVPRNRARQGARTGTSALRWAASAGRGEPSAPSWYDEGKPLLSARGGHRTQDSGNGAHPPDPAWAHTNEVCTHRIAKPRQ